MVILALALALAGLAGCSSARSTPNTVRGVQVVAIESTPAEPRPNDLLTLGAWVADGQERGADVLIWLCTPYEGRCAEAYPPGSTGLPLSIWARTGYADPLFETTTPWPLAASIADQSFELPEELRGKLLVWALACAPGVCPLIDDVAVDPRSGSEAYERASRMLADPTQWLDELPRHQVSVAVKAVPVDLEPEFDEDTPFDDYLRDTGSSRPGPGPNHAPRITAQPFEPGSKVRLLDLADSDGDPLLTRSFITAGGVYQEQRGETQIAVLKQDPIAPTRSEGVLFVVAEDGRGGTAVYTDHPAFDPCQRPLSATIGVEPGAPISLVREGGPWGVEIPWEVHTGDPLLQVSLSITVGSEPPQTIADSGLQPRSSQCERSDRTVFAWLPSQAAACAALGSPVSIALEASSFDGPARSDVAAFTSGVLVPGNDSLRRFCEEL